MNNNVKELQEKQFDGLNDFMANLSKDLLEVLYDKYGDGLMDIVDKVDIDLFGLYRWHLQRILSIIDAVIIKYGTETVDIVSEKFCANRYNEGVKLAHELGGNSLEDFTFKNYGNILERKENEIKVKSQGCFAGMIANELGRSDILFQFFCKTDHAFVSGFNPKLGCEHIKTIMNGDECCIHRYYVKDSV